MDVAAYAAWRDAVLDSFVTGYWCWPGPSQVRDPRDFLPDATTPPETLAYWRVCYELAEAGIPWPEPTPGEWGMGLNRERDAVGVARANDGVKRD